MHRPVTGVTADAAALAVFFCARRLSRYLVTALLMAAVVSPAAGQTTVFSDGFNRAALDVGAAATYTTTVTAGDGGAAVVSSSFLQLTNDATATANASGRVFVSAPITAFTSGDNSTLSANTGPIKWTVNLRYNPSTPAGGFNAGKLGLAVVLGATAADLTTGNGYAIATGYNGKSDRVQLVKFPNGLTADNNLTAVVAAPTGNLAGITDYASVRVRYDSATSQWSLCVRDDGAIAWADPSSGVTNLIGTATDSTCATVNLASFGFFWNYGSSGTQTASTTTSR
jgi:hypothetical protein